MPRRNLSGALSAARARAGLATRPAAARAPVVCRNWRRLPADMREPPGWRAEPGDTNAHHARRRRDCKGFMAISAAPAPGLRGGMRWPPHGYRALRWRAARP